MIHDDHNATGAAPVRARFEDGSERASSPDLEPVVSHPQDLPGLPPPPRFRAEVPEDLRVPWGWLDLLQFIGFGFLSLLIAGGIVVGLAVFGFGVQVRDLSSTSTSAANPIVRVLAQVVWSGFVLLYFFAMVRTRAASPFWRTMGWRGLQLGGQPTSVSAFLCLGGGAVLALFVSFAGRFINENGELPIEKMFHSRPAVILLMFFGILVAPLVEETIFRGFLYPMFARSFGVGVGVVVTGVLFGAMHAQQLWGGWGQIGLLIGVGILLTWMRAWAGTVAASYLMHLGYNSLIFLGFFAATGGLRHLPGAS